jgi:hypothetical protein
MERRHEKILQWNAADSVALTMLVGAESAYAEAHRGTLDATNGQQDRGTAIDTQATGEEGISGPRVKVKPGDVLDGGRVIGGRSGSIHPRPASARVQLGTARLIVQNSVQARYRAGLVRLDMSGPFWC